MLCVTGEALSYVHMCMVKDKYVIYYFKIVILLVVPLFSKCICNLITFFPPVTYWNAAILFTQSCYMYSISSQAWVKVQ